MSSEDAIYRELQEKIHTTTPVGFPASEDGTDIKLLKMLLSPDEAKIAIQLGALPEPLKRINRRINRSGISISLEELEETLDKLVENGVIMGGAMLYDREKGIKRYSLAQWAVGIYEFQLGRMTKEFAQLANKYTHETFYTEMFR
ncbi:MAG: hypothetical protein ACFE8B_13250, partial [Candidatus Hermodarchaeota archaeon]